MQAIKVINQVVAFSLEIAMLVALGYYGFQSSKSSLWKYALMIALPLIAAVLWGIFAAPRSATRLGQPMRMFFSLTLFLVTAYLLYRTGNARYAIIFAVLAILSQFTELLFKE